MLLQSLYQYGENHHVALPAGCTRKTPKGFILLTNDGQFIGIEPNNQPIICPSIFTEVYSGNKSDVFVEKRGILLGEDGPQGNEEKFRNKRDFFLSVLQENSNSNEDFLVFKKALEDEEIVQKIKNECNSLKIKVGDAITCKVGGRCIASDQRTIDLWAHKKESEQIDAEGKGTKQLCLITGELAPPVKTTNLIMGLNIVGGAGTGDRLICFDKPSYQSYDLPQNEIAPLSENACNVFSLALQKLVDEAPSMAGVKFVHWYDHEIQKDDDILMLPLWGTEEDNDSSDSSKDDETFNPDKERKAIIQANALIEKIRSGGDASVIDNVYHILLVSGYSGRIIIRRYEVGSYEDLAEHIHQWYQDTSLVSISGTGIGKHYKLNSMMLAIIKNDKAKNVFDQANKELSSCATAIFGAIINGNQIPPLIVQKSMERIRTNLLNPDKGNTPEFRATQWLKAFLVRNERKKYNKEVTTAMLNENHPSAAYQCGRLMAVYDCIQSTAMPNANVSVVQKFYGACIQRPARILDQLDKLSIHHLAKIDNDGRRKNLSEMLNSVYSKIDGKIPDHLDTEGRAYFVLGYHQQAAELNRLHYTKKVPGETENNKEGKE